MIMEMYLLVIISVCFSIIAFIFTIVSILIFSNKVKVFNKTIDYLISPQRERLENIIYRRTQPLTSDPGFFADANHILFDGPLNNDMIIRTTLPDFSFFNDMGINIADIRVNDRLIACLMPFNKRFDKIKYAISSTCERLDYICRRSDDVLIENNTDIRRSIVRLILEAKVVIAVLDGRNPNVFYEIGIAQSMGKLVLMVVNLNSEDSQAHGGRQPVDLLSNRLITYNNVSELQFKLKKTLMAVKYDNR